MKGDVGALGSPGGKRAPFSPEHGIALLPCPSQASWGAGFWGDPQKWFWVGVGRVKRVTLK